MKENNSTCPSCGSAKAIEQECWNCAHGSDNDKPCTVCDGSGTLAGFYTCEDCFYCWVGTSIPEMALAAEEA
jgi:hypothetical protein